MNIKLDIERRLLLPVDHARAATLLDDLEATIGRFPNLKKLTKLGANQYRWDLRTMGVRIARIAHDLSYAATYEIDSKAGAIRWKPLPGHGNALIGGEIRLAPNGAQTEMTFKVELIETSSGDYYGKGYQDVQNRVPKITNTMKDLGCPRIMKINTTLRNIFEAYRDHVDQARSLME